MVTGDDQRPGRAVFRNGRMFARRLAEEPMLLALFFVLLVLWLLGFFAFHVAGGLIHLLIIVAVIVLLVHLFTGRRAV